MEKWTPDEVREARLKLGLTQAELAAKLGLDGDYAKDTVRGWESGKRAVPGPVQLVLMGLLSRSRRLARQR